MTVMILKIFLLYLSFLLFFNDFCFGNVSKQLNLYVTGRQVSNELLVNEVRQLLESNKLAISDAFVLKTKLPETIAPGDSILVSIPLPQNGATKLKQIKIHIENYLLPQFSQTFLMFSDHPETIRKSGLLFQGGLIPFRTVRFNYYHVNAEREPDRELLLVVKNKTKVPSLLHLMGATAGPSPWEMEVGHRVNVQFLEARESGNGRIYEIPPHSQITIKSHSMPPGQLVSGLLELQLVLGKPLEFCLYARIPGEEFSQELLSDDKDVHARGVYEVPELTADLRVKDDEEKSLLLGDLPLENLFQGRTLKGSYGIFWRAMVTLVNDTNVSRQMGIYFQPRGGKATGTFYIDNKLREISPTPPYKEVLLAAIDVPPKTERKVPIISLPEGASNYPVKIIVRNRIKEPLLRDVKLQIMEQNGEKFISLRDLLNSGVIRGTLDLDEKNMILEEQLPSISVTDKDKNKVIFGQALMKMDGDMIKPLPYFKIYLFSKNSLISDDTHNELIKNWIQNNDPAFKENSGLVKETSTDINGYYFFENIPKGEYELLALYGKLGASRVGYWLIPVSIGEESVRRDLLKDELRFITRR